MESARDSDYFSVAHEATVDDSSPSTHQAGQIGPQQSQLSPGRTSGTSNLPQPSRLPVPSGQRAEAERTVSPSRQKEVARKRSRANPFFFEN